MIAALVAGSVFAADMAACAQDSTNPPAQRPPGGPGARSRFAVDTIAPQLALTDDQKTKAKPVFEELNQKLAELRKDTSLEATAKRAKNKELLDAATTKLETILTPEQMAKWKKLAAPGRRPGGGAGAPPAATPPAQQ